MIRKTYLFLKVLSGILLMPVVIAVIGGAKRLSDWARNTIYGKK